MVLVPQFKSCAQPFRKGRRQGDTGSHARTNGHLEERKRTQESKKDKKDKKDKEGK